MEVSPRARLAWANRNLEEAADIIVADYLRELTKETVGLELNETDLLEVAYMLDPEGATA